MLHPTKYRLHLEQELTVSLSSLFQPILRQYGKVVKVRFFVFIDITGQMPPQKWIRLILSYIPDIDHIPPRISKGASSLHLSGGQADSTVTDTATACFYVPERVLYCIVAVRHQSAGQEWSLDKTG
jgi:hypothetical protein